MAVDTKPTQAGFLTFIRTVMNVTIQNLPDNDPAIELSYVIAVEIVNEALQLGSCILYTQAVYNLAADNLIMYAQNQAGTTYWSDLRDKWNTLKFVPGVIQSASDVSTSESMVIQEAAKNFTMANLQQLKSPYGRMYMAISQDFGPAVWGIS